MDYVTMDFMGKFSQEQLERAAHEERQAQDARITHKNRTIKLKRGFSLRRFFARQS